jgi:predicted TPR repeat methyltransferase
MGRMRQLQQLVAAQPVRYIDAMTHANFKYHSYAVCSTHCCCCCREQLRLEPTNSLAAFWLAAVEPAAAAAAPVAACPSSLVAKLFDGYADNFDSHLVDKLQYKTPSMLMWVVDCRQKALG